MTERVIARRDVVASDPAYRTAIAELPLSARESAQILGAVVVLAGLAGWADAVQRAADGGAEAVVVIDPAPTPSATLRVLLDTVSIPVVVQRPLLRTDAARAAVAARAGMAPRLLAVDGSSPRSRMFEVVRDAAGWLRVLGGEPLALREADGPLALLETPSGIAATLSVVTAEGSGRGWLRVQALGEITTEVEAVDATARVVTLSRDGQTVAPMTYESAERLALRRALETLSEPVVPRDLEELLADSELARALLLAHVPTRLAS